MKNIKDIPTIDLKGYTKGKDIESEKDLFEVLGVNSMKEAREELEISDRSRVFILFVFFLRIFVFPIVDVILFIKKKWKKYLKN